jgi:hypothetical protein
MTVYVSIDGPDVRVYTDLGDTHRGPVAGADDDVAGADDDLAAIDEVVDEPDGGQRVPGDHDAAGPAVVTARLAGYGEWRNQSSARISVAASPQGRRTRK